MTAVIIASATKSSADSKVGLGFAQGNHGKIMLTSINETGLFRDSDLRPGLELVSVNGTTVRGMSANEVKAILGSIKDEVTVQAQPATQSYTLEAPRGIDGEFIKFTIPDEPILFKSKKVPNEEWKKFASTFRDELLPSIHKTVNLAQTFSKEMDSFVGSQMMRGYVGFGTESMQEKKAFVLTHNAALEHSNLSMIATNLVMEANATFNPYGIWAKLVFSERHLPKIPGVQGLQVSTMVPVGIKFIAPASSRF
mmetsp:Transcript_15452/g.29496  ORF Transcript_15452/g.29496 Transcript_15452/m.29496 type:complete len:253 (+) Transcript_15452:92-850(+)